MRRKVLILCTGNSARSQMAEAIINARLSPDWQAFSAGTVPTGSVHPGATRALAEIGIQHQGRSKPVDEFKGQAFDLVVTVCDNAREACPVFPKPIPAIHLPFHDPHGEPLESFLAVRDDIRARLIAAVRDRLGLQAAA